MDITSRRRFLTFGAAMAATMAAGTWSSLGSANGASAQQLLRIGVAYISPPAEVGWTRQHSLAVEAIRAEFGDRVEIVAVDNVFEPQHAELVFRDLAANGFHLIFGTSFVHGQPMQTVAAEFPAVAFENCAPGITLENLGTFEARYYEGAFVAGVAAGRMTQTGRIGFISPFPVPDFVAAANAFLLGARSVNAEAVCEAVFLQSWFSPEEERAAVARLIEQDCDVICPMTDSAAGVLAAEELGAWTIGYASDMVMFAPERHLTAFTLDWSSVYLSAARAVVAGDWKAEARWQGFAEGVVAMAPYSDAMPEEVQSELAKVEADVASGALHPFGGEIRDRQGDVRVAAGSVLADAGIRAMDWYVEGMIGD